MMNSFDFEEESAKHDAIVAAMTPFDKIKKIKRNNLQLMKMDRYLEKKVSRILKDYFKKPLDQRVIYITNYEMIHRSDCFETHPGAVVTHTSDILVNGSSYYCAICGYYISTHEGCGSCDVMMRIPYSLWERVYSCFSQLQYLTEGWKWFRKRFYWLPKRGYHWFFEVDDISHSYFNLELKPDHDGDTWLERDLKYMLSRSTFESDIRWIGTLPDGLGEKDLEDAVKCWFKDRYDLEINVKWVPNDLD
jgi:hypothetical protein